MMLFIVYIYARHVNVGRRPQQRVRCIEKPVCSAHAHTSQALEEKVQLMYEAAVLRSGYELKDAPAFAQRIERILRTALEIDHTQPVDAEAEVPEDDDDDDDEVCVGFVLFSHLSCI